MRLQDTTNLLRDVFPMIDAIDVATYSAIIDQSKQNGQTVAGLRPSAENDAVGFRPEQRSMTIGSAPLFAIVMRWCASSALL
jgi:hypothetical protein